MCLKFITSWNSLVSYNTGRKSKFPYAKLSFLDSLLFPTSNKLIDLTTLEFYTTVLVQEL